MRRAPSWSVLAVACLMGIGANARAETKDDMCTQPKMATDKWKARSEVAGIDHANSSGVHCGRAQPIWAALHRSAGLHLLAVTRSLSPR